MKQSWLSFTENSGNSIFILVLITLLVYCKSFFFDFSPMDEDWLIIRDQSFLNDWGNVLRAFHDAIQGLYYRPVQIVSYIIDYHLGAASPFIYHFNNVALHTISVVMLYKLLLEFNIDKARSFFLAVLFAAHPVALQAVAWVPGRHDLLLCVFALSSFFHLARYIKYNKITNAIFHFLFFWLALFTKENSIFLFPLFAFVFFIFPPLNRKKMILFIGIWLVQLLSWHLMLSAVIKTTLTAGAGFMITLKSFSYAMLMFIGKSFFPLHQSVSPIFDAISVTAGIIAIVLVVAVWYKLGVSNTKTALFGVGIYFGLLAVAVWFGSTLPTGEHLEHRVYTSMIGIIFLLSQFRWSLNSKITNGIVCVAIVIFALKTFFRLEVYRDGISYLTEAVEECPKNYFYHARLGNFLYDKDRLNEALDQYNIAVSLYDKKPQVFNDRANTYVKLNRKNEAIADYTKAYELGKNPQVLLYRCMTFNQFKDYENAYKDLVILQQCCRDLIPKGLEQEITRQFKVINFKTLNKMIAAEPNNALLYVSRAKFYVDNRMGREALADLKKACELEPGNEVYKGYFNELNASFPH